MREDQTKPAAAAPIQKRAVWQRVEPRLINDLKSFKRQKRAIRTPKINPFRHKNPRVLQGLSQGLSEFDLTLKRATKFKGVARDC